MAQLDMSDALLEPSFQDNYRVVRRSQTVNKFGETVIVETRFTAFGVVTIGGDNDLDRGADEEHADKGLSIVTRQPLQTAVEGRQPDLVFWHGSYFVVTTCDDYTGYGLGWYQCMAKSQTYNDPAQFAGVFGVADFSDPQQSGFVPCCLK